MLVAGCSGSTGSTSSGGSPQASIASSHLGKIIKAKKIRIGVQSDAAPYASRNAQGKYEGVDIDIATALATALNAVPDFVPVTDTSRIPSLQADKIDIIIAALGVNTTRAQQLTYTSPYLLGTTLFAVKKSSGIESYADLNGKSVAASQGSIGLVLLKSDFPKVKPLVLAGFADGAQALASGKAQALISDDVTIGQLVESDPSLKVIPGRPLQPSWVAMGVTTGDQIWLNYVNNFIRTYNISDAGQQSYQKWLHHAMPTNLMN
jgi:polar amino acid transport system substrate-binding protein